MTFRELPIGLVIYSPGGELLLLQIQTTGPCFNEVSFAVAAQSGAHFAETS